MTRGLFLALSSVLVVMTGCRAGEPSRADAQAPAARTERVAPLALPDVSRAAPDVQRQLREGYAAVQRLASEPGATAQQRAAAYGDLGMSLLAAEYLDAAAACFENASTLDAHDRRWLYLDAHVFRMKHDPAKAAALFERALALEPTDVPTLLWLADMQLEIDRPDAAAGPLEKARSLAPQSASVHDALGRAALARREYRESVAELEQALALAPAATRPHYPLGLAYRALGDRANAEKHLALRGDVDVPRPDPLMEQVGSRLRNAAAYEVRGSRALEEHRWRDAVADLREAATLAPDNAVTRLNLGNALYQAGDAAGAIEQLRAAVRLSPKLAQAHYSLGVLAEIDGRDADALEAFRAAVAADPGYVDARLALAEALRRTGRLDEALPLYASVTRTNPELSQARFGHAMALVRLRRFSDARDLLEHGARTFPDQPGFAHALARLLAAAPDDHVRDGARAVTIVQDLLARQKSVALAETMAMAFAETGNFDEAIGWQEAAIAGARQSGPAALLATLNHNLARYRQHQPCRVPWSDDDPVHHPRAVR